MQGHPLSWVSRRVRRLQCQDKAGELASRWLFGAKTSSIRSVTAKEGATGSLCFVTVHHLTTVHGKVCIDEEQDIVYRDDPDALVRSPKPAPGSADSATP